MLITTLRSRGIPRPYSPHNFLNGERIEGMANEMQLDPEAGAATYDFAYRARARPLITEIGEAADQFRRINQKFPDLTGGFGFGVNVIGGIAK